MSKDEALKLALEAFNDLAAWNDGEVGSHMDEPYAAEVARRTITAVNKALAQPEQPRVRTGNCLRVGVCASEGHKIQPQRKPLTDEEMQAVCAKTWSYDPYVIARAIEAAHGIKGLI